jgi:16S rRNA (cytosine1402-N4)-methyltransferase
MPVLCREAVDLLLTNRAGTYVDGTVGGGGHAGEICSRLFAQGRLVCFDADRDALDHARERLALYTGRVLYTHANFRNLRAELAAHGVEIMHGLLLDLGVSSHQFDVASRGFSFRGNDRLDMRMDRRQSLTAWDVVNHAGAEELTTILRTYGEEPNARRIARRIVERRPIDTTQALGAIVESVSSGRFLTKSLARVFQALRIHVNDELGSLRQALTEAMEVLTPGGRIVVIAYHSLEDRIVKDVFHAEAAKRIAAETPYARTAERTPRLRLLTRKPLVPGADEVSANPRARSAKLRAAERTAER